MGLSLKRWVCLQRHGYHLIEWWQYGEKPYDSTWNLWRCKWCEVVVTSHGLGKAPGRVEPMRFCRMNGPIHVHKNRSGWRVLDE